ncbi:MAG TPA: GIY-YIG nuclease family protein [Polyangiaceae bacterium]|nr:GIY-YIG nuclease family protein [Polyangiaceae bacterium]
MTKDHIIREIRRLAAANSDRGPGREVFERETGIKQPEWYPHIWLRWGDALAEAGYAPNSLQTRMSDDIVIQKYIELVRELGRLPVEGERRRKARTDKSFPSHRIFDRFGGRTGLLDAVSDYCRKRPDLEDVAKIVSAAQRTPEKAARDATSTVPAIAGYVYLMKSGRHFKIGRTNSMDRRSNELSIKIPVPPKTIHSIATDDPAGVEAYWHRRFADKRGEGEWFDLSPDDVRAFKRWKRIALSNREHG